MCRTWKRVNTDVPCQRAKKQAPPTAIIAVGGACFHMT